jgi:hypothetical protein
MEMLRGCRMHLDRFVKGLKEGDLGKAQLGLAHSYSRAKVKFNVNRADNMIIQVPPSLSSRSPPPHPLIAAFSSSDFPPAVGVRPAALRHTLTHGTFGATRQPATSMAGVDFSHCHIVPQKPRGRVLSPPTALRG